MSFNGSGTFVINTAGQPVVSGTVISSTAFNALTADLATGLSTAITKDGQTTPTANIPMGNNKITGLAVGTAATDAANLSQVQSTTAKLINSISGTDTITGTMSPTLGAYATGQMFYFIAAGDNTGAVTLNIDSLGAKAVTRDGSVALAASDLKSGEVVVVVYDGTRFQVVSQLNSAGDARFANVSIASTLYVGGVATFTSGTAAAPAITTAGDTNTGIFFPAADTIAFTEGGVESMRIDSSGNLGLGVTPSAWGSGIRGFQSGRASLYGSGATAGFGYNYWNDGTNWKYTNTDAATFIQCGSTINFYTAPSGTAGNTISFTQAMTLDASGNLGIGTSSPATRFDVRNTASTTGSIVNIANSSSAAAGNIVPIRFFTGNTFGGLEQCAAIWGINPNAATNNGGALVFATSDNGTATTPSERARITSGGDFLVGATSQLNGTGATISTGGRAVSCTLAIQSDNGAGYNARIYLENAGSDSAFLTFQRSTNRLFASVTTENSGPYVSSGGTSWTTNSDARLKTNVRDVGYGLNAVLALAPRKYEYTNNPKKDCFGFIAQDVLGVIPEIVDVPKDDNEMMGIEYQAIIPVLVKAIQELSAKVAALEAK